MKILTQRFPKGSLPGQITDGRYIDEQYYENLKILAEVITHDMTFMAIVSSSTLEVGTGKSVFVQQTAEAWIDLVNQIHKMNLPNLSMQNIVFKPKDVIKRAFEVPKYSPIIIDEWEDAHYWSELGMTMRQFFRKCRQLNLFIILIIPNFFQMPSSYAITRSVFFVDVRFEGKFERGHFRFFSFKKKKDLYIYGKKTQDYDCVRPDFIGRFTKGYVVDEDEYRRAKHKDMVDSEQEVKKLSELDIRIKVIKEIRDKLPALTTGMIAEIYGVTQRSAQRWVSNDENNVEIVGNHENDAVIQYINNSKVSDNDLVEQEVV